MLSRLVAHVCHKPLSYVLGSLGLLIVTALPGLTLAKDTRADAFLAPDNPALVYRDQVASIFGLSDPLAILIEDSGPNVIFNAQSLGILREISREVSSLPNIRSNKVFSLATESVFEGNDEGLSVTPYYGDEPLTRELIESIRDRLASFPLHQGILVAESGQAAMITAQMIDSSLAEETYQQLMELVSAQRPPADVTIHVAGEGAIAGYLGRYINEDAMRLNPIVGIVILGIIVFAFKGWMPALLAGVIILASVLMTLGMMGLFGIPFYVITNALPVILVGVSVADSIHVFSSYSEIRHRYPDLSQQEAVRQSVSELVRPITITSITTMTGFLGLYISSDMPPFQYFGLFAAFGVGVAWLYSLVFLPAAMILFRMKPGVPAQRVARRGIQAPLRGIGEKCANALAPRSGLILAIFIPLVVTSLILASRVTVDGERIALFHPSEAIFQADRAINHHMNGTNVMDIVVETPAPEGLLDPENLRKIEALQTYVETFDNVTQSTSIVDYLKLMNREIRGGGNSEYRVPESSDLAAQYFLLYSLSSDPTDFEEEIDYDRQLANIRVSLKSGRYSDIRPVVEQTQEYVETHFDTADLKATVTGRVTLNYYWIKGIGDSHIKSVLISLSLILVVASISLRSGVGGLFTLASVVSSVIVIYAVMAVMGIGIEVGTSMFAAVAIGLGVDFAIHTIDKMRVLQARYGGRFDSMLTEFYQSTGKALYLNALAISTGFGVLILSNVAQLGQFGLIVVLAMVVSFLVSLTVLPAFIKVVRPRFMREAIANREGYEQV